MYASEYTLLVEISFIQSTNVHFSSQHFSKPQIYIHFNGLSLMEHNRWQTFNNVEFTINSITMFLKNFRYLHACTGAEQLHTKTFPSYFLQSTNPNDWFPSCLANNITDYWLNLLPLWGNPIETCESHNLYWWHLLCNNQVCGRGRAVNCYRNSCSSKPDWLADWRWDKKPHNQIFMYAMRHSHLIFGPHKTLFFFCLSNIFTGK